MTNHEGISEQLAPVEAGFFNTLINGNFGLARTYWLYGVLVGLAVSLVSRAITSIATLVLLIALYTAYEIPVLIGTWRAANKYQGPKVWVVLAKIAIVLGLILLVAGLFSMLALIRQI